MTRTILISFLFTLAGAVTAFGQVSITGELKKWHKVTLTFDGPSTSETATPNPFTDYRLDVTFSIGDTAYVVPGYFAADGNAAETGASSGNKWRVHFAPDSVGVWTYSVSFRSGPNIAVNEGNGSPVSLDGLTGMFEIEPTDKTGIDNRARGRLQYVGEHYLRYAETGDYFIKVGADAPENFLAYDDFDNTPDNGNLRKSWGPHVSDWDSGDPVWQGSKGKGIIGAVNYLASEGQNVFSFLTMNIIGDDENVFPYISDGSADRTRMDCSKLDQWETVFSHADTKGMYLHFKTQEQENDQLLDGGALGTQRKIYYRELIARFSHHLALNWNIGEENTNTTQQRKDFAEYFHDHDPYRHHIVIHTFRGSVDEVYSQLIGDQSLYTGASIQTTWNEVHKRTITWVNNSADEGRKWVVANDEQGGANIGVPHDAFTGSPTQKQIRNAVLWGNLMAGGGGVEYYFGYSLPQSDLTCQDFRSRDQMWDYNRYAHQFFTQYIPFWEMSSHNALIGNSGNNSSRYCFAKLGQTYVIYLPNGGSTQLNLENNTATFQVRWFNPRSGGNLQTGSVETITGPGSSSIGNPPSSSNLDWAVLITADPVSCPPAGTSCNDGNAATFDDVQDGECNCTGTPCPPAGTTCDDGNPATENDVEDGFCNCSGSFSGGDEDIWFEAECAIVGSNWSIEIDNNASNGSYLLPPNTTSLDDVPTGVEDLVTFQVTVSQTGNYKIFARTMTTADPEDSFWVRANGGNWVRWNKINADNYGNFYQWEQVGEWTSGSTSNPVTFNLNAGANTIHFAWREPGIRLDKIYITLTGGEPNGIGGEPGGGCAACPPAGTSCDDGDPSTTDDVEDGNCNCAGTACPPAGTACDDGDPATTDDVEDGNCNCAGTGCAPAGTACDDGDPATTDDVEDGNCNCAGTACPPAGTACDDGDPATTDDVEDGNCNCAGTGCAPAGTACDDGNPNTENDVEDGNCNCAGIDPNNEDDQWLEAECAIVGAQWTLETDAAASNGGYVLPPNSTSTSTPPTDPADLVTFEFSISQSGPYKVFGRTLTLDGDSNSFWVRANDGDWQQWNSINAGSFGPDYQWEQVGNWTGGSGNDPVTFFLNAGVNTVDFAWREPGTHLDKIYVTQNGSEPTGIGGNPGGGCTSCPPAGTACDDGDPATTDDVEDGNCNCAGTACPPAGTACDDGNPATTDDVEDGNCNCAGTACPPAGTACDDGNPATTDDVEDGNCNCAGTACPPAGTACDDGDPSTTDDVEDGNCNCAGTACPPAGTACDDGNPSTTDDVEDGNCNCAGTACPPAGTACDDGDPATTDDVEDGNCNCAGTACPPAGTACDDGDPSTTDDVEDGNCNCAGTACPPAGTACDDGDPATTDDVEDGNCNCAGTACPPAGTACDDGDPATTDDVEDGNCNCAGTACPPAGTACDDGDPATTDDVEDGNCNCAGTACPPAGTACDDGDPATTDDVEDGNCNCIGDLVRVDTVMEAECALVGASWSILESLDASNDAFVMPPAEFSREQAPESPEDLVRFTFEVPFAGEYWIFARAMTFDEESNSFWARMDEGDWILWNKVNDGNEGQFGWDQIGDWENGQTASEPLVFALAGGAHTLDFSWREPNVHLDKIHIVNEEDMPAGMGPDAVGCAITSSTFGSGAGDAVGLILYPNPARDGIFVQLEGVPAKEVSLLEVMDAIGRVRLRQPWSSVGEEPVYLELGGWPAGMYWVRLRDADGEMLVRPFVLTDR